MIDFQHSLFTEAQAEAHRGCLRWEKLQPVWSWRFRLLEAEVIASRGLNQNVLSTLNADLPQQMAGGELSAQKLALEALALANMGHFPEANRRILEARSQCPPLQCEVYGKIAQLSGVIEIKQSQFHEAQDYCLASLHSARATKDQILEASALQNLGVVAGGMEHFDQAIDWFEQGVRAAHAIGSTFGEEKAQGNLGWAYSKLGDFENSLDHFTLAAQMAHRLGAVKDETFALYNLGFIYFQTGQLLPAEEEYKQSLTLARSTNSSDLILASLNALAFLSVNTGRLADASQYSQQAFAMAHSVHDRYDELPALLAEGELAAARSDFTPAQKLFTEVANDHASDTSLRWEAQRSLARLYENKKQTEAAEREYRLALQTVENARLTIRHADFRLPFLANAAHLYDDYIHFLIAHGRVNEALETADYSRAQTLAEGLGESTGSATQTTHFDAERIARETRSLILYYWIGPENSYLWAIDSSHVKLVQLPPAAQIDALVDSYRKVVTGPRDPLEISSPEGLNLYRILIEPVKDLIPPHGDVIVIPDGSLNTLNFETLLVPSPKLHYWIEDVTLETGSALKLLREKPSTSARQKLLLLGNPSTSPYGFPELANAPAEIADIKSHFAPAARQVFIGNQATPEAYLSSDPAQFTFIHFVAHGTASRLTPLESAVVLSSNAATGNSFKLYARDIVRHPLHAELVTISACYGAGTRYYAGEGLVGLSWAFLDAGAHNVIGALWEVSDASTPALMNDLYSELRKGLSPENALHAAKLRMLHSDTVFRKPFYWAPFQLYVGS